MGWFSRKKDPSKLINVQQQQQQQQQWFYLHSIIKITVITWR